MHLAFDLSYIHMEGRWRMPGSWPGYTYPDVRAFEEIARLAERGLLDMLFSGDGTGVPSTWQKAVMRQYAGVSRGRARTWRPWQWRCRG